MDATFLYVERPTMPQHVLGVMLLAEPIGRERLRRVLQDRIHLMPPFERSIVQVPLRLDHPYWVHDHEVDLDEHLHTASLPAPGDLRALGAFVGEIGSRALPRDRPLWELWLIDGLASGQVAMVAKMHHSTIYGSAGADLMAQLLDLTPEERAVEPVPAIPMEPAPSAMGLVSRAVMNGARRPVRVVKGVLGSGGRAASMAGSVGRAVVSKTPVTLPFSGPDTLINGRLTTARETAFTRVDFADIRLVKGVFGTKVNDVVLAAVTASLRNYLVARNALPSRPLVASVPVNVGAGAVAGTDKLSVIMVPLPVRTGDAVERLLECARSSLESKCFGDAIGIQALGEIADLVPPLLMIGTSKLYDSLGLSRLHPPLHSLIVSNMPGPPIPLYLAGIRVDAVYPFGPLLPGTGLNITVLSNMGNLDVGLMACPDLVPDLWEIADGFPSAVAELVARAEEARDA